ncbi:UvrD-helicase domain-containing protein [Ferroplasma sp.]|uniref:UvrD-helicase domain-containing protein n=1 Tax=Ferroplasma sp. TaxID=2591003 RepID=UPI00307DAF22
MIDKDTLVISNPGTGKTTRISSEVVNLIKEGIKPEKILCITFTNNAVSELQERINSQLLKEKIKNITAYDVNIYTFHALAYQEMVSSSTKNIVPYNIARYLIYKKLRDVKAFNYGRDYVINDIVPKFENAIRYIKSFGIMPSDIENNREIILESLENKYNTGKVKNIELEEEKYLFDYFYQAFKYYQENKKDFDFNDLLFEFYRLKNKKKYEYVFVDELQDVNDIESRIALEAGNIKFLVGDRKQSIFGFQGGALSVFNSLIKNNNISKKNMTKNYRSTDTIINYSKEYYLKFENEVPELDNFEGVKEKGNRVKIIESEFPEESIIGIINEIPESEGNIGIIARTNAQIETISSILDRYEIEYSSDSNIHSVNEAKKDITSFLKGLFYDDPDSIINAIVTPFSGISLKEAFNIAESIRNNEITIDSFDSENPFFSLRNKTFTKGSIVKLFDERILPVASSISSEYFITATAVISSIKEFFDTESEYNRKNFFDFLDLSYSENTGKPGTSRIILTTVHKAKGREFDNVIYLPKKPRKSDAYIDIIVSSIIEEIKHINVDDELKNESIRVDFVAFTRAKNNLWICTSHRDAKNYSIPEYSEIIMDDSSPGRSEIPVKSKYDEAYFKFIAGDYSGAKDTLSTKETWLKDIIYSFFKDKNVLSYSLVSLDNPYWLLKNNILKLNEKTDALYYGLNAHELAESLYKEEIKMEMLEEKDKKVLSNIESVVNQIKAAYNMEQIEAEVSAIARVNQMFPEYENESDNIMFFGKIDAVFSDGKKYVILDYKTDKTTDNSAHHRVQLLAYKLLYSLKNGIGIENIDTAIGYISLRGKINTNENTTGIVYKQPDKYSEANLKKYITRFLGYKNDPGKFIEDYLKYDCTDTLYERLAQLLQ